MHAHLRALEGLYRERYAQLVGVGANARCLPPLFQLHTGEPCLPRDEAVGAQVPRVSVEGAHVSGEGRVQITLCHQEGEHPMTGAFVALLRPGATLSGLSLNREAFPGRDGSPTSLLCPLC